MPKKKLPLFIFYITVSGRRLRNNGIMQDSKGNKILTTRKYDLVMDCNGKRIEETAQIKLKK